MDRLNIETSSDLFKELLNDPEFATAIEAINALIVPKKQKETKENRKKRNDDKDEDFKTNIKNNRCAVEKRQSLRIRNKSPIFKENDFSKENSFNYNNDSDIDDIEEVVYKIPTRKTIKKRAAPPKIIPVEEVTEMMINNVAKKVSTKQYSVNGTCCHQCRQKTLDQKTCCRNVECVGLRGMFCGVCLTNRYGEDAREALKNRNWHCPVCRGICNCSFCRSKIGKRPTGILTPLAYKYGYKSVREFLDSLNGTGDYAEETDDPNNLLGFTADIQYAQMGNKLRHSLTQPFDAEKFNRLIEDKKIKLSHLIYEYQCSK